MARRRSDDLLGAWAGLLTPFVEVGYIVGDQYVEYWDGLVFTVRETVWLYVGTLFVCAFLVGWRRRNDLWGSTSLTESADHWGLQLSYVVRTLFAGISAVGLALFAMIAMAANLGLLYVAFVPPNPSPPYVLVGIVASAAYVAVLIALVSGATSAAPYELDDGAWRARLWLSSPLVPPVYFAAGWVGSQIAVAVARHTVDGWVGITFLTIVALYGTIRVFCEYVAGFSRLTPLYLWIGIGWIAYDNWPQEALDEYYLEYDSRWDEGPHSKSQPRGHVPLFGD